MSPGYGVATTGMKRRRRISSPPSRRAALRTAGERRKLRAAAALSSCTQLTRGRRRSTYSSSASVGALPPARMHPPLPCSRDLVAAIVGTTRDGWAIAEGRGIRAARQRAVMADITANLADCDLTVASVAARHRISPRYVHKLFESESLTFSAFVLGQRLFRATEC